MYLLIKESIYWAAFPRCHDEIQLCFPEVFFLMLRTYKLNELRMPLYLMLVIDSNGQSEIASLLLTSLETKEAITNMVKAFKSANPSWY